MVAESLVFHAERPTQADPRGSAPVAQLADPTCLRYNHRFSGRIGLEGRFNMQTITGLQALEHTFAAARVERRATFMPFWTIGFPDLRTSLDMIDRLVAADAEIVQVGVPFSHP